MPEKDVEQLLVSLILDNHIQGHIDQVNRLLERNDRSINFLCNLASIYMFVVYDMKLVNFSCTGQRD